MKITITDDEKPTPEEAEEIFENAKNVDDEPGRFREQMQNINEVVIPQHVLDSLGAAGILADDLVAMLMGKAGKLS